MTVEDIIKEQKNKTSQEIKGIEPDQILNDILENSTAHSAATEAFISQLEFYGKTLDQWDIDLAVKIPDNPIPTDMRIIYAALANNIQKITHFLNAADSISSALDAGGKIKHSDLVKIIVESYEVRNAKRPGVDVINRMAESYMRNTVSTRIASKIIKDFWKRKYDTLQEVRKLAESIGISLASEMKYLSEGA